MCACRVWCEELLNMMRGVEGENWTCIEKHFCLKKIHTFEINLSEVERKSGEGIDQTEVSPLWRTKSWVVKKTYKSMFFNQAGWVA